MTTSCARSRDALEQKRGARHARGLTHAGPHRDDLALTLDGRELRAFGSAGQQRTAAIALRLLEAATLRERLGAAPLLLLDDPFAELDARRSARILELLARTGMGQTMLAVPRESDIPPALTRLARWRIAAGVITARCVEAQHEPREEEAAALGDVLAGVLERAGIAERVEQAGVIPEWPRWSGRRSRRVTEPQSIAADGTLFVHVTTNAWMNELSLMEPELLRALNAKAGRTPVRRIRWLLKRG